MDKASKNSFEAFEDEISESDNEVDLKNPFENLHRLGKENNPVCNYISYLNNIHFMKSVTRMHKIVDQNNTIIPTTITKS